MRSVVHIFDGYFVTQGRVRGRCSCGFLTTPQGARRAALQELDISHGFTSVVCASCGRGDRSRTGVGVGVPASLSVEVDPLTGDERLLCAQGSGGCDLTSQLGPEVTRQIAEAIDERRLPQFTGPVQEGQVAARDTATVGIATGLLMSRSCIDQTRARAQLAERAARQGVSEFQAAHRMVEAAAALRARPRPNHEPPVGT